MSPDAWGKKQDNMFVLFLAGTELPDDDYQTLMPQSQAVKTTNRNASQIPIIIENKENDTLLCKSQTSSRQNNNQRKTIITAISRRQSTIEQDPLEQTRSAPPSPASHHHVKPRSGHNQISMDAIEHETKSTAGEYGSLSVTGPSNSLSWGTLEVRLKFDAKNSKMWVFIVKATLEMTRCPSKQTLVQVHLTLLPSKRIRFRTQAKPIDNAMFAEEFFCKVSSETIQTQGIRFRLYTYERFKREKLLAEATVMFAMVNLDEDMCKIVPLERAYPSQDSDIGSRSHTNINSHSRQNSVVRNGDGTANSLLPELEIGLAYDRTQAMLILEIGKGINFGITAQNRAPDTYAQITLRNSTGEEILSNHTVIRHGQCHPIYAERYPFNIHESFLEQITLHIAIINKKSISKIDHDFGSISFGHDASGNSQISHWEAMLNSEGETITRWHTLLVK